MAKSTPTRLQEAGAYLANMVLSAPLKLALGLPYHTRVRLMGAVMSRGLAPLLGYRKRVINNLNLVWSDLPEAEKKRLARAVPDNFGRTLVEIYSGSDFKEHLATTQPEGPGLPALRQAQADGRPVILVSGHFGNHDAVRATVSRDFSPVGALYRPLDNSYFNDHWEQAIEGIAAPAFARGRRGLAQMVKYLRGGGIIALLVDQHVRDGAPLTFFGHPAKTTLSTAEMAVKYNALVLPVFGLRQPDGFSFRAIIQEEIPHDTPEVMAQAMNDALEAMVRKHPEQWFWVHRRWKG
ncbi:lysophospholipid acyltransferase family protein [Thalassobius sp. Cn5-15]|uniref:lysophospholipid acyltransferase family protein n=1 Tax=Thalassobius sp. Cn5-15 TaxID=2917763 RepID=UPI001EF34B67|nr:lysophospholipid acyltransferase family protein [Thalassobius sp. Cn5-15]MCG7492522.1 lysophospholipid acyltransferase family protein [Thalassobius sp. Cn5-15]